MWRCRCECGNEVVVRGLRMLAGKTRSCGCLEREVRDKRNFRHGDCKRGDKARLHNIWNQMRQRCRDTTGKKRYQAYGVSGVKVCAEWDDYTVFRDWAVANGYRENLTIERKDPFGNYEPGNCAWIPMVEQPLNTRKHPRDWTQPIDAR